VSSIPQLQQGNLHYSHTTLRMTSNNVILDDGKWHHVDIVWSMTSVCMMIDHVHKIEINFAGSMVAGESLTQTSLGDTAKTGNGFNGCIKGVMIAGSQLNLSSATRHMVTNGCSSKAKCQTNTCPRESVCKLEWRKIYCVCRNGYVGDKCRDVCSLRPCQNGALCQRTNDDVGFKCICPDKYLGQ
jgi:hypothetical protein